MQQARELLAPVYRWFTVVARVGSTGLNEDFPDPSKRDPNEPELAVLWRDREN